MNTTHIGKIGRLPKAIRHQLGIRLEDGLPGTEIVQWLNAQPDVQEVLHDYFQGRPITEQNLSEWRQTGHPDWLRRQDAQQAALRLVEHSQDLDQVASGDKLTQAFTTVFATELTRLAMALLEPETDPEKKWERLCQIHRELSRLRRDDDRAARTRLQEQRWEREAERMDQEEDRQMKEDHKKNMLTRITEALNIKADTEFFGGGEVGKKWAERLYRIRCGLPMDPPRSHILPQKPDPESACPPNTRPPTVSPAAGHTCAKTPENRHESKLIQPNPAADKSGQSQVRPATMQNPVASQLKQG